MMPFALKIFQANLSARATSKPVARRGVIGAMAAFIGFGWLSITPALADEAAEQFMQRVLADANKAMNQSSRDQQFAAIDQLVDDHVDMRRTGRFTLGQYARRMSDDQAKRFYPLFRDYATTIYQEILSEYTGEVLEVSGSIDRSAKDIIVNSKVAASNTGDRFSDTVIQWRLYKNAQGYKVVDAGANNIWLAIEQRSQFTSVIANNGGGSQGIDALINQLEERVGR